MSRPDMIPIFWPGMKSSGIFRWVHKTSWCGNKRKIKADNVSPIQSTQWSYHLVLFKGGSSSWFFCFIALDQFVRQFLRRGCSLMSDVYMAYFKSNVLSWNTYSVYAICLTNWYQNRVVRYWYRLNIWFQLPTSLMHYIDIVHSTSNRLSFWKNSSCRRLIVHNWQWLSGNSFWTIVLLYQVLLLLHCWKPMISCSDRWMAAAGRYTFLIPHHRLYYSW